MVRRLVEQQEIRPAGESARERRAGELAAGERLEAAVEIGVGEAEASEGDRGAVAPAVAARVLEPRLRFAVATKGSGAWSPAAIASSRRRSSRSVSIRSEAPESVYSRSVKPPSRGGRWSCSATRAPFSQASSPLASSVSPISARSSVVLPAPFGPASASRSRRSSLNETPSKSGSPENSFRSEDAIRTAMRHRVVTRGRRYETAASSWTSLRAACSIAAASIPAAASSSAGFPECGSSRTASLTTR